MGVICELCGTPITGKAYRAVIDRTEMIVCSKCASKASSIKEIINERVKFSKPKIFHKKKKPRIEIVQDIVEDYPERIRKAREELGLTREVLATMIGEKVSIIRRLEEGTLQPSLSLAKKLEKVLRVKLIEEYEERYGSWESGGTYEPTLGDIAEFKEG